MQNLLKNRPWLFFLLLALVTQQTCLLTYKFGAEHVETYVFITYAFIVQCITNIILMFSLRKHFPIAIEPRMRLWLIAVTGLYLLNELTLITVYDFKAPFSLMTAIFSLSSLAILILIGVTFLKEKIEPRKIIGIILAIFAILLIKFG